MNFDASTLMNGDCARRASRRAISVLPDAGRTDHQDVLRRDFFGEFWRQLLPAHPVTQRDGHGALGLGLTDDVLVELGDDLARGERLGRRCGGFW